MLISTNKQWHRNVRFQRRGLTNSRSPCWDSSIPSELGNQSYLPSTVRDAMVNLIPIEFADYMSTCNERGMNSGEINLAGAPLDVLNSLFKLGS